MMWVASHSFSLIVLFASSKAKFTWSAMRDPLPSRGFTQDWIPGNAPCLDQAFCPPPQIPSPCFPHHPALGGPKPAVHSIRSQKSLATSREETHPFGFLCQIKHGYSQCATRLSKVKTFKIL